MQDKKYVFKVISVENKSWENKYRIQVIEEADPTEENIVLNGDGYYHIQILHNKEWKTIDKSSDKKVILNIWNDLTWVPNEHIKNQINFINNQNNNFVNKDSDNELESVNYKMEYNYIYSYNSFYTINGKETYRIKTTDGKNVTKDNIIYSKDGTIIIEKMNNDDFKWYQDRCFINPQSVIDYFNDLDTIDPNDFKSPINFMNSNLINKKLVVLGLHDRDYHYNNLIDYKVIGSMIHITCEPNDSNAKTFKATHPIKQIAGWFEMEGE